MQGFVGDFHGSPFRIQFPVQQPAKKSTQLKQMNEITANYFD
jgi:hypothetical protein